MKKIVRILGLIVVIFSNKHYTKKNKFSIFRSLIFLEFKSYFFSKSNKEVKIKIINYTIYTIGYKNVCLLFKEIFINEDYNYLKVTGNDLIFDCGANIGLASIYFKWRFPNCKIMAFEPDPTAFALLSKNIKCNNLVDVELYNYAVMENEGEIDFFITFENDASLMMSTIKGRMNQRIIKVKGISLSQWLLTYKPKFLKIDIEGAEKIIFSKINQTSAIQSLDHLIIEYHHKINGERSQFASFLNILEQNGFEYNIATNFLELKEFQDILIHAYK